LFEMFDDVLLLGLGGRTVYIGPSGGALPYFEGLGFELPRNENPADWFMDVIAGKVSNSTIKEFKPSMLFKCWQEHQPVPASDFLAASPVNPSGKSGSPRPSAMRRSHLSLSPRTNAASPSPRFEVPQEVACETCPEKEDIEEFNAAKGTETEFTVADETITKAAEVVPMAGGFSIALTSAKVPPCNPPAADGPQLPSAWRKSMTAQSQMVCLPADPFLLCASPGHAADSIPPSPADSIVADSGLASKTIQNEDSAQRSKLLPIQKPQNSALLSPRHASDHPREARPTLLGSPKRTPCEPGKPSLPADVMAESPAHAEYDLERSLDDKWSRIDLDDDGVLNREELAKMLTLAKDSAPSEAVVNELCECIGFEDGVLTKDRLLEFLLGLNGPPALVLDINGDTPVSKKPSGTATPCSRRYPSAQVRRSASFVQNRSLNTFSQYRVLLHQTAVRWLRMWQQRAFSITLIVFAGLIFGHESMDKLGVDHPLAPARLNVSHCALGLMTAMPCLTVFGSDRPIFWRMSASGMNVLAFFLARLTLCAVDVLLFTYIFTLVWFFISGAPYNFWTYFRAYRLSSISGATWGLFISTLVPPHSSTLAVAVVILVMGSAVSEPQTIAEAPETYRHWLAMFSPFTYSVGENYLADVDEAGQDQVFFLAEDIVKGYLDVMHIGTFKHTTSTYIASGLLALFTLTGAYLCLRFTHRGKQM